MIKSGAIKDKEESDPWPTTPERAELTDRISSNRIPKVAAMEEEHLETRAKVAKLSPEKAVHREQIH